MAKEDRLTEGWGAMGRRSDDEPTFFGAATEKMTISLDSFHHLVGAARNPLWLKDLCERSPHGSMGKRYGARKSS